MNKETPKVKSLVGMAVMTAVIIGCVAYYYWQIISAYIAGGEGAPTLSTLIFGGIILAAGCIYVVSCAVRIYIQERKRRKEAEESTEKGPEA